MTAPQTKVHLLMHPSSTKGSFSRQTSRKIKPRLKKWEKVDSHISDETKSLLQYLLVIDNPVNNLWRQNLLL